MIDSLGPRTLLALCLEIDTLNHYEIRSRTGLSLSDIRFITNEHLSIIRDCRKTIENQFVPLGEIKNEKEVDLVA
jgi:hypothetical protein